MNISVVMVTYNRLECLKKSLKCYEQQTNQPKSIFVIDNNSSDGTQEYLREWETTPSIIEKKVLFLEENIGGSGGFSKGVEIALLSANEWIWLADDDAYPDLDAFEKLGEFYNKNKNENIVALCSENYGTNGIVNTDRAIKGKLDFLGFEKPAMIEDYNKESFKVDYFTFVGVLIKKEIAQKVGAPVSDYFIYSDDIEYSERINRCGDIICVPSVKVFHDGNCTPNIELTWREYYMTRNLLVRVKKYKGSFAFAIRSMCRLLSALRQKDKCNRISMYLVAIKDAKNSKMGKHQVYKPGWIKK